MVYEVHVSIAPNSGGISFFFPNNGEGNYPNFFNNYYYLSDATDSTIYYIP